MNGASPWAARRWFISSMNLSSAALRTHPESCGGVLSAITILPIAEMQLAKEILFS